MKTKKSKASILVVTLIILGIMLVTALSVSLVSIKERVTSMGDIKSNQAFQNAQSGVEIVMKAITQDGYSKVNLIPDCALSGLITDGSIGYSVQLLDKDDNLISCSSATPIANIASIKSIGTGSGEQRAIEAAVAATGDLTKVCDGWSAIADQWIYSSAVPSSFTIAQCKALMNGAYGPANNAKWYAVCCFDSSKSNGLNCSSAKDPFDETVSAPSPNCGW